MGQGFLFFGGESFLFVNVIMVMVGRFRGGGCLLIGYLAGNRNSHGRLILALTVFVGDRTGSGRGCG